MSTSEDKQDEVIEAFNTTSRYIEDLLNIGNNCFDGMVNQNLPIRRTSVK